MLAKADRLDGGGSVEGSLIVKDYIFNEAKELEVEL